MIHYFIMFSTVCTKLRGHNSREIAVQTCALSLNHAFPFNIVVDVLLENFSFTIFRLRA